MGSLFLNSEVAVTDLHHVHVVVGIEVDIVKVLYILNKDTCDIRPVINTSNDINFDNQVVGNLTNQEGLESLDILHECPTFAPHVHTSAFPQLHRE